MERLQKYLAECGVASRRKSEELITLGHVSINDIVVRELGTQVGLNDVVKVDGVIVQKEDHVYYVLNKPVGYITSVKDEHNRPTILDLFEENDKKNRIYPVGRLDFDTAGVLLVTNDGAFSNKLTKANFEVEKEYVARVEGLVTKYEIVELKKGVVLKTGYKTKPCKARVISSDKRNNTSLINIIIHEGKNHQVRLMCDAIGHPVKKLTRVRVGNVTLEGIPKGCYRKLKIHEIKELMGR